ncbi:hypothetical protein MTO96_051392 [Rhipicephalus appendiculatus]
MGESALKSHARSTMHSRIVKMAAENSMETYLTASSSDQRSTSSAPSHATDLSSACKSHEVVTDAEILWTLKASILENARKFGLKRKKAEGEHEKLEKALVKWLLQSRSSAINTDGTILKEKADLVALRLGIDDFKASNGWLDRFKKHNNIVYSRSCGESSSVDVSTVQEWKESLPDLIAEYRPCDVFNADESGIFYHMQPEKTLTIKGDSYGIRSYVCTCDATEDVLLDIAKLQGKLLWMGSRKVQKTLTNFFKVRAMFRYGSRESRQRNGGTLKTIEYASGHKVHNMALKTWLSYPKITDTLKEWALIHSEKLSIKILHGRPTEQKSGNLSNSKAAGIATRRSKANSRTA